MEIQGNSQKARSESVTEKYYSFQAENRLLNLNWAKSEWIFYRSSPGTLVFLDFESLDFNLKIGSWKYKSSNTARKSLSHLLMAQEHNSGRIRCRWITGDGKEWDEKRFESCPIFPTPILPNIVPYLWSFSCKSFHNLCEFSTFIVFIRLITAFLEYKLIIEFKRI